MMEWKSTRGLLIDLDGTLIQGNHPIDGAVEFIQQVVKLNIPFLYWTNNSTRSPLSVARMMGQRGFAGDERNVYTSGIATALWLTKELPGNPRVYVVGEPELREVLVENGIRIVDSVNEKVDAVVVGLDRDVHFKKLSDAMAHLLDGALFIGTNPDHALVTKTGLVPGAGSLLALLERATKRVPYVIGKPNPQFVLSACERLNVSPHEVIVIGDNPETDVHAGRLAGAQTIWVKTGIQSEEAVSADLQIASLRDLLD